MNDSYIRILLTELHKQGYPQAKYLPEEKILKLNPNCSMLYIKWDEDGELLVHSCQRGSGCPDKIISLVRQATALFRAWENAEPMPFPEVSRFRKLLDWNNYVLAARDDGGRGLYFVTWQYSGNRAGVGLGHYMSSFYEAKLDFIRRSELIHQESVFDFEQLDIIQKALRYRLENDGGMYPDDTEKLEGLLSGLDYIIKNRAEKREG